MSIRYNERPNAGYVKKWVTWLSLYLLTGCESMLSSVAPISGCSVFLSDHATFPDFISLPYKFILLVNFFQDDTRGVTHKLLIITALAIFRVVKIPTLKIANYLLPSGLWVALAEAVS